DAFAMADQVLYSGVACITDLMVKEGLINLDFADVRAIMRGMGKAMMGTGEASGEKRANRAAEAAIANPLLDDVSMKGARGLLISITGGSDLTLYELDEAATRIREEVDQDANIILGATFDESLDGIIRVSVVATGIEPLLISANSPNNPAIAETEQRIAEVAERLRAEARARAASPVPSIRTESVAPAHAPMQAAPQPAPEMRAAPVLETPASVTRDDVVLAPVQPRAAAPFMPAPAPLPVEPAQPLQAGPFVPPRPAAPTGAPLARAPRMPQIHELPPIAQTQIMASRAADEPAPESKRTSLLRRLATLGSGGRRDDAETGALPTRTAPSAPQPQMAQPQVPPAPRAPAPPAVPQYRPAQGNLDAQGRLAPQSRMMDDDQLEIPAFLRRQAN
ncbi:MAG: cell division protein FtsZ, partial [Parafilimonas terrae]|nr:cell division protein FtsZ [Parafilimonas terrae]